MKTYSDKVLFDNWIKNCPIDNPEVIAPVVETTNDDGEYCYLVPVHVLIKRDQFTWPNGEKPSVGDEYIAST